MISEQVVEQWIDAHREQLLGDILALCCIPSVSNPGAAEKPYGKPCRDALELALSLGKQYGFAATDHAGHFGSLSTRPKKRSIGVWCHLDVVPAGDGWEYEPFAPILRDGFLVGRGVRDNKGPAMAALYALRFLQECDLPLRHSLSLYLGCSEENGMLDLDWYDSHVGRYPNFSLVADGRYPVGFGEKGQLMLRLTSSAPLSGAVAALFGGSAPGVVPPSAQACLRCAGQERRLCETGISKHAAFPEGSRNAIHPLLRSMLNQEALCDDDSAILSFLLKSEGHEGAGLGIAARDATSGDLTCVATLLALDDENRACLTLNIRFPHSVKQRWILEQIETLCRENGFSCQVLRATEPYMFPVEHPVVRSLTNNYNLLSGSHRQPHVLPGSTYAGRLPNAVTFGMGGMDEDPAGVVLPGHGGAHGPDECVLFDNLLLSVKIYILGILSIDTLL